MLVLFANSEGEEDKNASMEPKDEVNYFNQGGILNLKNNNFQEELVSLESCFTRNDATNVEAPIEELSSKKVQETKKGNIKTMDNPKLLNLGIFCLEEENFQFVELFKELYDFFASS